MRNPKEEGSKHLPANDVFAGEALVLYFDLLGVSSLFSLSAGKTAYTKNIERLANLFEALDPVRILAGVPKRNGVVVPETIAAAMFSDSMYIVDAVSEYGPSDFEGTLAGQLAVCSECQTNLLHHGFICRGAITKGLVVVDGNFIAGPACSRTAVFDKHGYGYPPVVFIDKDLILSSYRNSCAAICNPVNRAFFLFTNDWRYKLLYDTAVDEFFFNYMSEWYEVCTDVDDTEREECLKVLETNLAAQQTFIKSQLDMYLKSESMKNCEECRKSRFLANYHNFVIRLYAEQDRFKDTAKYVVTVPRKMPLPPATIAVAHPYLRKLVIEEAYSQGQSNVDADFYSDHDPAGDDE